MSRLLRTVFSFGRGSNAARGDTGSPAVSADGKGDSRRPEARRPQAGIGMGDGGGAGGCAHLLSLNMDCLSLIMASLDVRDLAKLSLVCKGTWRICDDEVAWKAGCCALFREAAYATLSREDPEALLRWTRLPTFKKLYSALRTLGCWPEGAWEVQPWQDFGGGSSRSGFPTTRPITDAYSMAQYVSSRPPSMILHVEVCQHTPRLDGYLLPSASSCGATKRLFAVEFTPDVHTGVHIATSEATMNKSFFSSYADLPRCASGIFKWEKPAEPCPGAQPIPLEFCLMSEPSGMSRLSSARVPSREGLQSSETPVGIQERSAEVLSRAASAVKRCFANQTLVRRHIAICTYMGLPGSLPAAVPPSAGQQLADATLLNLLEGMWVTSTHTGNEITATVVRSPAARSQGAQGRMPSTLLEAAADTWGGDDVEPLKVVIQPASSPLCPTKPMSVTILPDVLLPDINLLLHDNKWLAASISNTADLEKEDSEEDANPTPHVTGQQDVLLMRNERKLPPSSLQQRPILAMYAVKATDGHLLASNLRGSGMGMVVIYKRPASPEWESGDRRIAFSLILPHYQYGSQLVWRLIDFKTPTYLTRERGPLSA